MKELIECLKKYDKDHKNFYETYKEEIISKPKSGCLCRYGG